MASTSYIPIEKGDEIEESPHELEPVGLLLGEAGSPSKRRPRSLRTCLPWFIHVILLLLSASMLFLAAKHEHAAQLKHSSFSPALTSVDVYHTTRFNGTLDAPSPYRGPPSEELDEAWSRVADIGLFGLSDTEFGRGPPSEELDEAWSRVADIGLFGLSDTEFGRINPTHGDSAVRLPDERGGQKAGSLEDEIIMNFIIKLSESKNSFAFGFLGSEKYVY